MSAGSLTLLQIRTAAKQRADMENSQFVTDSEWTQMINQSYYELYDLLVQKYGNDYYVAPPLTIAVNGTSQSYPLPDGVLYSAAPAFYKLLGVDLQLGPNADSFVTIQPFMFADRNRYATPNFQSFYGVTNLRYRLNGANILFTPIPTANQNIQIWYVPRLTELVTDGDVADGVSGWDEYIIVDAAIKAMQKEESDVTVLMAQKQALIARIEAAGENRDAGSPQRVSDSQSSDFWWPNGASGSGQGEF